jgi:hypothetical protein
MIYAIAERWRALGHSVLVHQGLENPADADPAVLNVDPTVLRVIGILGGFQHLNLTIELVGDRIFRDL